MINNTISVCLIVKNEDKNLSRCLNSVVHMADEIVVVDTGSTDNTIEIAKQFTDKVISHEWKNDFSDARNKSLENATKDWILFLDADEELDYNNSLAIKSLINENPKIEAFHLRLVNIIENVNVGDSIVLRLFKNKPEYRFRGKMHEQIVTCIEELNPPGCLGSTDIKILHYGYDHTLYDIQKKQKRNLDLLNSYPEEDRDGYFYYSLGNEYARLFENDKALEIYEEALKIPIDPNNTPIYLPYLYANILKVHGNDTRYNKVIEASKKFQHVFPNFKDLYFYEALAYIQIWKFSKGRESLLKYLNCPSGNYEYPVSNFELQYNISDILNNLNANSIPKKDNDLLSVIIMANEDSISIYETIKTINEIANEVYVVISRKTARTINKDKIESFGACVIEVDSESKSDIFMKGCSECTSKYILLLKPNEVSNIQSNVSIVQLLEHSDDNNFNISLIDQLNNLISTEFRLYKNSLKLRDFKGFDDYSNYIYLNSIKDTPISLYKTMSN